jgi:hypothetical protein
MAKFNGFKRFLQKIRNFIAAKEVDEEIKLDSGEIVKMVQLQLAKGTDGLGEPVYLIRDGQEHFDYALRTIRRKNSLSGSIGSITDHITNYMSGRFYSSLFVETYGDGSWQVRSNSPLIDLIKTRSGQAIIDLSPESQRYLLKNKIAPDLQAEIKKLFLAP